MSSSPPAPSAPADGGQTAPDLRRSPRCRDGGPGRVEVNEVSENDGFIARFFHLFEGRVEQRVQTGRFHFLSDAAVGVDVGNLTDGHHVALFFIDQFLQHGRRWRFNGQVVTVTGTLEVTGLVADKRTRDHAANVITAFGQLFTGDFAQLVEFIQAKGLFVAGNLEHGVSGGVKIGLPVFMCSSPSWSRITVPEEWQLPR